MSKAKKQPTATLPGAAISALRRAQGLSYRELAARIERHGETVDHTHLYRIETEGANVTAAVLARIARGLGVAPADLWIDPRLAPLATLPDDTRAVAEAKVAVYVADLVAAAKHTA
jgi:transcriptional regulator with XRE-family HTH domain